MKTTSENLDFELFFKEYCLWRDRWAGYNGKNKFSLFFPFQEKQHKFEGDGEFNLVYENL